MEVFMEEKYVIKTENGISECMPREEAIEKVKKYSNQGIEAYIVSEDEGERIKKSKWNKPKWS